LSLVETLELEFASLTTFNRTAFATRATARVRPYNIRVGRCSYHLRRPGGEAMAEDSLTVRQQILLLGKLAFYCGVG